MSGFITDSDIDLPDDVALPEILKDKRPEVMAFFRGYVTDMLWVNVTWGTDNGAPPEGFNNSDIRLTQDQLRTLSEDVVAFVEAQFKDLANYACRRMDDVGGWFTAWEQAGEDFALTRNGHGAGFWDRSLGELGERLKEASKPYGEAHIDAAVEGEQLKTWIES